MGLFRKKTSSAAPAAPQVPLVSGEILKVGRCLTENRICFFSGAGPRLQIFSDLVQALGLPSPEAALTAILAREQAGSTVIAPGLAIPHARIDGIDRLESSLGIIPAGAASPDGAGPIHVIVLFVGPKQNMRDHLAFLASVSALFQSEGLVDALKQLATPEAVLQKIREVEQAL
jgi:PTS system nitrogen regulatory IIA component